MQTRQINPKLLEFFKTQTIKRLGPEKYEFMVRNKRARSLLLEFFLSLLGQKEQGHNKGPIISLLQDTIGDIETEPYCAGAVQSVIAAVETVINVKSDIYPSEHCLTMALKTPVHCHVQTAPGPGAIIVWQHGQTPQGHTGLFVRHDEHPEYMICAEANTGSNFSSGTVVREGDGIYLTRRHRHHDGNMHIIKMLKPFPLDPVIIDS